MVEVRRRREQAVELKDNKKVRDRGGKEVGEEGGSRSCRAT